MSKIPLFWMNEQTGKMRQIVMAFLEYKQLSREDLEILKNYIIQWIEGTISQVKAMGGIPAIPPNYKEKITQANQKMLSDYIVYELLDYGIDPL